MKAKKTLSLQEWRNFADRTRKMLKQELSLPKPELALVAHYTVRIAQYDAMAEHLSAEQVPETW